MTIQKILGEENTQLKIDLQNINKKPKIVFHYTSQSGFKSIIENKKLWFSNIAYLNDYAEPYYIFDLLNKYLEKNILNLNTSFFNILKENIETYIEYNEKNNDEYIASFSRDKNNLFLWNYYSKGSETGFNIGFKLEEIINLQNSTQTKSLNYMSFFGNVVYDKDTQKRLIEKVLLKYNELYKKIYKIGNIEENTSVFLKYLFSIFYYYNLFFKDEVFEIEKEWRLVIVYTTNPELIRMDKGLFIPYYEFSFDEKAIQNINFYTLNNKNLAAKGINHFLQKNGMNISANSSENTKRY